MVEREVQQKCVGKSAKREQSKNHDKSKTETRNAIKTNKAQQTKQSWNGPKLTELCAP